MPEEPQELAATEWGTITYHPQWNTLELTWSPNTRTMGDDGFQETLQLLADQGLKVRPRYMIIDATQFFHTLGEGILAWRDEHIVPLYNEAGVLRLTPGLSSVGPPPVTRVSHVLATLMMTGSRSSRTCPSSSDL